MYSGEVHFGDVGGEGESLPVPDSVQINVSRSNFQKQRVVFFHPVQFKPALRLNRG